MQIDNTTIQDLAIFNNGQEDCVFDHFNKTRTVAGKFQLIKNLSQPLSSLENIRGVSETIKRLQNIAWPATISNGTIMVVEQFCETRFDGLPKRSSHFNAKIYRVINSQDYTLAKYSIGHFFTFFKGMKEITEIFSTESNPAPLQTIIDKINNFITRTELNIFFKYNSAESFPPAQMLTTAHYLRYNFRKYIPELIELYAQIDAWYAVGIAAKEYNLSETIWVDNKPTFESKGLFHLLLKNPVPYDLLLDHEKNFLFLTSANMAGKSTFIKAVGVAVYVAHCGFPVPAKSLKLSVFDGLLSNINITDNLSRGESYFYNEVQRISETVSRINDGKNWFVLIDELFKGTNVQDAMKCSTVVTEGLLKIRTSLFILSTHLYEIAEQLAQHNNIQFKHFETTIVNDRPVFHYNLKDGVSNDRLGYLILKQSGVVEILNNL